MLNYEELKQLAKKYFTEASEEQIEILLGDLTRELEIMTHAKIRELVDFERRKKITGQ
ncbi:hypothetical protein [Pelosinus sp. UFO1]|uniref:hypothetical protein n=1 Tax=Pelosinus sp. UFO1 TaxID=484770 RepID=UPI0004D10DF3|nr:hypothetical protein [Pelosinus sp. UFO1]AIF54098.1 hypothetical protein UFO1_4563 [Pelosinus sp. UFO1]